MNCNKHIFKFSTFIFILNYLFFFGQNKAYWKEIEEFKNIDKTNVIPKKSVLFLGSSSFTNWTDINDYFPGKRIINRAFGGARLLDLNNYADELLDPYSPKQIIIYCGENDIAMDDPPAAEVFERFKTFYGKIKAKYAKVYIAYVSIKYSPSRERFWPIIAEVNQMIESYLKTQNRTDYIDITKVMIDSDGRVRTDIFLEDMLQMKPKGYQLWAKVILPYLK